MAFKLEPLDQFDVTAAEELKQVGPIDLYVKQQIDGKAALFKATFDGERCGSCLLRLETDASGDKAMVIVAGFAKTPVSIIEAALKQIEAMARGQSASHCRVHTDRPGLMMKLLNRGAEAVLKWDV